MEQAFQDLSPCPNITGVNGISFPPINFVKTDSFFPSEEKEERHGNNQIWETFPATVTPLLHFSAYLHSGELCPLQSYKRKQN